MNSNAWQTHSTCMIALTGTHHKQVPDAYFVLDIVLGNHTAGGDTSMVIADIHGRLQHLHIQHKLDLTFQLILLV